MIFFYGNLAIQTQSIKKYTSLTSICACVLCPGKTKFQPRVSHSYTTRYTFDCCQTFQEFKNVVKPSKYPKTEKGKGQENGYSTDIK